jgi:hypothetical protein
MRQFRINLDYRRPAKLFAEARGVVARPRRKKVRGAVGQRREFSGLNCLLD